MFDIDDDKICQFQIGDKIICIRACVIYGFGNDGLKIGNVYTIINFTDHGSVFLKEVYGAWLQNRFEKCST